MKMLDIVHRAARNLGLAKSRTLLTAVAVSVGGFAIIASLAAGTGARQYVDRVISANMDVQSLAVYKDERLTDFSNVSSFAGGLQEYNPDKISAQGIDVVSLTQKDISIVEARDDIQQVVPVYMVKAQYMTFSVHGTKKYTSDIIGYDASTTKQTEAGSLPEVHHQLETDEAAVPASFAKELGVPADKLVGSTVTVRVVQPPKEATADDIKKAFLKGGEKAVRRLTEGKTMDKTYRIRAVIATSVNELDQRQGIFISNDAAKILNDFSTKGTSQYQKYMMAIATVQSGHDPKDVKESLKKDDLYANTAEDIQEMLFTFVNILQSIVIGFGLLALIVSIFGIVNTQYISVLERTNQIGLMKALGASRRDIARMFRYEAAWVGFFGGVLGTALAWVAGTLLNPVITDALNLGEGNSLLVFEVWPALGVILLLVVVAVVSGWLPSRKAAKLDPIVALRTE